MAEHERVDFGVGGNVPTGADSIAFANVEVLGHKLNYACSRTIILIEDDPALHGHVVLLFLVKLKESVQHGVIRGLCLPNTEQLWGYLHVVPSEDDPGAESGIREWNQSFTFQHLSGLIDHDVGEVTRGDLQLLG